VGNIIKKNEMGGACSAYGGGKRCVQGSSGETGGKRPLRRPRRRWEDNIKMDLQKVGWGYGLDQAGSGQGQVASTCECGNELLGSIKCREFFD
jgi:hypothetical protein